MEAAISAFLFISSYKMFAKFSICDRHFCFENIFIVTIQKWDLRVKTLDFEKLFKQRFIPDG